MNIVKSLVFILLARPRFDFGQIFHFKVHTRIELQLRLRLELRNNGIILDPFPGCIRWLRLLLEQVDKLTLLLYNDDICDLLTWNERSILKSLSPLLRDLNCLLLLLLGDSTCSKSLGILKNLSHLLRVNSVEDIEEVCSINLLTLR